MYEQEIKGELHDLKHVLSWADSLYKELITPIEHYRRLWDSPAPLKKVSKQKSMWFGHSPRWKLTVKIVERKLRNGSGSTGKFPHITYLPEKNDNE